MRPSAVHPGFKLQHPTSVGSQALVTPPTAGSASRNDVTAAIDASIVLASAVSQGTAYLSSPLVGSTSALCVGCVGWGFNDKTAQVLWDELRGISVMTKRLKSS